MSEKLKEDLLSDGQKNQLVSFFVKRVMAFLVSKLSFLAGGPLAYIATHLLTKLVGYLLKEGIIGLNHLIINLEVDGSVIPMEKARQEFFDLMKEGGATDEQLDNIDKGLTEDARDLIRFGRKRL